MNAYLTIMVTVLVLTQIVRITQNHISLRRQERSIRENIAWLNEAEPTKTDFDNQREVFRMLRYKLAAEEEAIIAEAEGGGENGRE